MFNQLNFVTVTMCGNMCFIKHDIDVMLRDSAGNGRIKITFDPKQKMDRM